MSVSDTKRLNSKKGAPQARPQKLKINWGYVGIAPFFIFAILFLFLPSASIFIRSFQIPRSSIHL